MIIKKTFKYRLKPNRIQETCFYQFAGACRWLYNFALEKKKKVFEAEKKRLSYFDLNNLLPSLKREEETLWLKDVHSQVLQQSLKDLHRAFENFFRRVKSSEKSGFPKFKKRGSVDSFRYPQGAKVKGKEVYFPKIGWVKFRKSREIEGAVKQTTVIREINRWYVCFSCEIDVGEELPQISEVSAAGIDLGLEKFATIAYGLDDEIREVQNPRFFRRYLGKLRFLSRQLSRKVKGSRNRMKARLKLQKLQEKLKNCRRDFAHKESFQLVKNHDIVGVETLSIQSMQQKSFRNLARSIADASWRQFLSFVQYKLEHMQKVFVEASRWFASTQQCCKCHRLMKMELSQREYACECGNRLGRDANAAINLRNMALKKYKAAGTTV